MSWKTNYERWINEKHLDTELKEWLETHQDDHQALEDCFYKTLSSALEECAVRLVQARTE